MVVLHWLFWNNVVKNSKMLVSIAEAISTQKKYLLHVKWCRLGLHSLRPFKTWLFTVISLFIQEALSPCDFLSQGSLFNRYMPQHFCIDNGWTLLCTKKVIWKWYQNMRSKMSNNPPGCCESFSYGWNNIIFFIGVSFRG